MKHLRHLVHIVSARFFTLPSSQKENVTPILHSSFYILHLITASARFFPLPFSLFTKIRKCNFHSSFFILHSSFFIFHFSFYILNFSFFILHLRRAQCRARYRPIFSPFFTIFLDKYQRKGKYRIFFEKISPKVLVVRKKAVPLHSLSGKRYC